MNAIAMLENHRKWKAASRTENEWRCWVERLLGESNALVLMHEQGTWQKAADAIAAEAQSFVDQEIAGLLDSAGADLRNGALQAAYVTACRARELARECDSVLGQSARILADEIARQVVAIKHAHLADAHARRSGDHAFMANLEAEYARNEADIEELAKTNCLYGRTEIARIKRINATIRNRITAFYAKRAERMARIEAQR